MAALSGNASTLRLQAHRNCLPLAHREIARNASTRGRTSLLACKPRHNIESYSLSWTLSRRSSVSLMFFTATAPLLPASGYAAECSLQTSPSGLQYCDLVEGTGPFPIKGAFIKCHYTAKLADSPDYFDSSYQRKQPLIFKVGEREVIAGWDQGILGTEGIPPMKEGGIRRLVLPAGQLQRMGTKSLVWMTGLMDALPDFEESADRPAMVFDVELLPRRRR